MYDDFYDDYSPFEQQVDEFKQSLLKCIKDEVITELEALRKENAELQDIKRNVAEFRREHRQKIKELEMEIKTVGKKRIADLLKDYTQDFWYISDRYTKYKKCDECNEKRYINFTAPQGQPMEVYCTCYKTIYVKYPKKVGLMNISVPNNHNKDFNFYFERGTEYTQETHVEVIISSENDFDKYKDGYSKTTIFTSEELCQKYCDLLNKDIDFSQLESEEQ